MHEASEGMLLYCTTPTRLEAEIYMAKRESKCECQKMMHAIIVPCIRRMNFIQDLLIMPTTKPPLSNDFVAS